MEIPELQLETWSHQGSVTQSAKTYDTVQEVLNDSALPLLLEELLDFPTRVVWQLHKRVPEW